jgi:hypothetical protein
MKSYFLVALFLFLFSNSFAQQTSNAQLETKLNEQIAYNLNYKKDEIKLIDDSPLRCALNIKIATFIFEKKILNYYDSSNSLLIGCLVDIKEHVLEFDGSHATFLQAHIFSLLKKYSPNEAEAIEKKYNNDKEQSILSYLQELDKTNNVGNVTTKIVSDINKGIVPNTILFVYFKLQQKSPSDAVRLLDALLPYFENIQNFINYQTIVVPHFSSVYLAETTKEATRNRFLQLTIALGQKAIIETENTSLTKTSLDLLRSSIPIIKKQSESDYQKATAIFLTLSSKNALENKEESEIYERIRNSKDKLEQTISEASEVKNTILKDRLWIKAARIALSEKKFQISVECIQKIESTETQFISWRYQFLIDDVLPQILKSNDFDSADYLIKQIENSGEKGRALLLVASKYIELKDVLTAQTKIDEAMLLFEKLENNTDKMKLTLSAVGIALKVNKNQAFDIVNSTIKTINNIPSPTSDEKIGTESRKKYVNQISLDVSSSLGTSFDLLAKTDNVLAESYASSIQRREWRLSAQISIEMQRKQYNPTKKEKVKTAKSTEKLLTTKN